MRNVTFSYANGGLHTPPCSSHNFRNFADGRPTVELHVDDTLSIFGNPQNVETSKLVSSVHQQAATLPNNAACGNNKRLCRSTIPSSKKVASLLLLFALNFGFSSQAWAWDISAGVTIYYDNLISNYSQPYMTIRKSDGNQYDYDFTRIGSTTFYYKYFSEKWEGYDGIWYRNSDWSPKSSYEKYSISQNCVIVGKGRDEGSGIGMYTTYKKAYPNTRIYWDNSQSDANWNKVYLRYGFDCVNHAHEFSKFPGTTNLYYIDVPEAYYGKYTVSNNCGYTNANNVDQPSSSVTPTGNYAITKQLEYSATDINNGNSVSTFTISQVHGTSYDCTFYDYNISHSIPQHTVTIKKLTHGTITASYYGTDGQYYNSTSRTNEDHVIYVPRTGQVQITLTTDNGYSGTLAVGGSSFTSGNTYTVTSNIDISANVTPHTTTVTFAKNDGSESSFNVNVAYDSRERIAVPNTSDTTRTGYTFNNYWTTTSGGTETSNKMTSLINNGQLYFVNGTRTDYLTSGKWSKDGGTATFYARWSAKTYNIVLEAGDDPNTTDGAATVKFDGASMSITTPPTRTGYNIAGTNAFCSDAACQNQVATGTGSLKRGSIYTYTDKDNWNHDATGTVTLYTNWTARKCTLQLSNNGADIATGDAQKVVTYDASPAKITTPQKTGNVFAGYYTLDGTTSTDWGLQIIDDKGAFVANVTDYMADGKWAYAGELTAMTLYAKWNSPDPRKVTFGITDGTNTTNERGTISASYKDGETSIAINSGASVPFGKEVTISWDNFVKGQYYTSNSAYISGNWYDKADISDAATQLKTGTNSYTVTIASADINAYVYAKPVLYDVTVPTVEHGTASATPTQAGPHFKSELTATPADGYDFTGWSIDKTDDGKFVDEKTASDATTYVAAKAAITVTPSYTIHNYNITYNGLEEGTHSNPATYTIETPTITLTDASRIGYDFDGWYSDNGIWEQKITTIKLGSHEDVVLYAKWQAQTYNITYKDEGNIDYSGNNSSSLPKNHTYDTPTALVDGTQTGYEFQGWFKESECSGTAVTTIGAQEITENLTLYAKWQINTYTLNLPDTTTASGNVCNFKIDSVKPAPVDGKYDYDTPIQVYLSPKDGYRLDVTATYNDGTAHDLPLTHNDFSFEYSFNMPTGNATISVEPKEYKIGGDWDNWANKESFPENNNKIVKHFEAGNSYKFKIWNDTYHHAEESQDNHYMGTEGQWEVWETTAGCVVTCAGRACFNLNVGITGDYTFTIGTSTDNKPMINIAYPDTSYIVYNGTRYGFTQYGNTDKFISTGILFPNAGADYTATLVWNGSYYMNDNDNQMTSDSHTDWGYKIASNHPEGIKIRTTYQAKDGDYYYFIFDPKSYKENNVTKRHLTAVYPSYIAGTWTSWQFTQPLSFDGDTIATYTHNFTAEEKAKDGGIQFKIVYEGKWYSVNTDQTFTRTGSKTLSQDDKHPNMTLTPNALDDEYTFTFNKTNKQLTVYYPEANKYKVQVSEDGINFEEKEIGSTSGIMLHAASKSGYRFTGWETTGDINLADKNAQTTNVKANSAGTVKATYSNDGFVYFRDPYKSAWGKAHAYFYSTSYWDDKKGSGSKNIQHGPYGMAKVEGSDDNNPIYYFDYKSNFQDWPANIIAFTNNYCQGSDNFNMVQAAYRADFNSSLPMYVPRNFKTHYLNSSEYYNEGIWMKFNDKESGYDLRGYFNNWTSYSNKFVANEATPNNFDFYTTVYLEAGKWYDFLIYNENGTQYGCPNQEIKTKIDGEHGWKFYEGKGNCKILANASGDYRFHISLKSGEIILYVTYPMEAGDYRVNYGTGDAIRYSNVIKGNQESGLISLWLPNGTTTLNFEKVESIAGDGTITWESAKTVNVTTSAAGVYQMTLTSTGTISDDLTAYTGDFFIRTDCADGGWDNYLTNPDNKMVNNEQQPEYSADHTNGYNYYFMKFNRAASGNVRFAVANTINGNLSGIMKGDAIIGNDKETLPNQQANIRFSWNSNTNTLNRAYMSGSTDIAARFLVLQADDKVFDKNGKDLTTAGGGKIEGLNEHELNFADNGNWVYQADIQAQPTARGRLIATYKDHIQYFLGAEGETLTDANTVQILGGSSDNTDKYLLRAVYDFKTNQLITAWLPVSDDMPIGKVTPINADMMLIREGQAAPQAITFSGEGKLIDIKSIYGVIELKKAKMTHANMQSTWSANNGYSYQYCNYYISFPFDVKISEITGIGTYGSVWQIQKYDGALRASIGWFAETKTFWTTMAVTDKLEKNVGYLLQLDRGTFKDKSNNIWANIPDDGSVYIYFPSESEQIGSIEHSTTATTTVPSHPCGINQTFAQDADKEEKDRRNHMQTDSHWNMIGAPLFSPQNGLNIFATTETKGQFNYFYKWDYTKNAMNIQDATGYQFQPMHGYMVQYAGEITWTGSAIITPVSIAARRLGDDNKNYKVDLQILNNKEERVSRTYVELAEGANDDFQLNEDVYMMANSTDAGIYSFAGGYDVAANVLSVKNHEIPLGIEVKTAGTYTFHTPSQLDGLAILVDHAANIETILNADDYSVYLDKGTCEGRFSLKLDVERKIGTDINGADYQGRKDIFKYIDNDHMYILRDGRLYNANGAELSK